MFPARIGIFVAGKRGKDMSKIEAIRHHLHDVIDQIDDESVLTQILGQISSEVNIGSADFWDDLHPEEKAGILRAMVQVNDPSKQISHEEAIQRHAPWRIK